MTYHIDICWLKLEWIRKWTWMISFQFVVVVLSFWSVAFFWLSLFWFYYDRRWFVFICFEFSVLCLVSPRRTGNRKWVFFTLRKEESGRDFRKRKDGFCFYWSLWLWKRFKTFRHYFLCKNVWFFVFLFKTLLLKPFCSYFCRHLSWQNFKILRTFNDS